MRGDLPAAQHRLEAAESQVNAAASAGLTLVRGWPVAAGARTPEAVTILSGALHDAEPLRSSWLWRPYWLQMFMKFAMTAGDRRCAATAVDIAERAARQNPGALSLQGIAVQMRGLLDEDLAAIARGADLLDRSPRPILRAGGHEAYGRYLLSVGRREEGTARLDRAWDIYRSGGAWPKLEAVRRELREAGIRRAKWGPADQPAPGWAALSEAEIRVARLIADGYSNRLAARELGLSINTIGSHLRSIFGKLDIQSRVQLANLLHAPRRPRMKQAVRSRPPKLGSR